jgi:anti-anti-sigma regulatory factor
VPLIVFPVVLPYRYDGDPDDRYQIGQAQVLASAPPAALAAAQVLLSAQALLRAPGRTPRMAPTRARVGAPGAAIDGLYAYLIPRQGMIQHLHFPSRLDQDQGARMGDVLAGLDAESLFGVVFDAHRLAYLNTMAIASLTAHADRLHLQICRCSEGVRKVFDLVGIAAILGIHDDLPRALAGLVRAHRGQ